MSKQCSTCKTVNIMPLNMLYRPLTWNPPEYQCFQCKKVFTEEEYKELKEGGFIPKLFNVEGDIKR